MAQVVKPSAASSDRQVKLHPLVLINISDHYTREKCRPESSPLYTGAQRVAGVLFGVQKGNTVDIYESFEMLYTRDSSSGILKFDEDLLQRKKAQCKLFAIVRFRRLQAGSTLRNLGDLPFFPCYFTTFSLSHNLLL